MLNHRCIVIGARTRERGKSHARAVLADPTEESVEGSQAHAMGVQELELSH